MTLYFGELKRQKNTVSFLRDCKNFSKKKAIFFFKKIKDKERKVKEEQI